MARARDYAWRPRLLPGCVLWLRADLGVTVGTGASAWTCQASGTVFSQGTGSKQPTINAADAQLNGQRSLTFTPASSQSLVAASYAHAASSYLIVAAYYQTSTTGGQYLFAQSLFAMTPVDGSTGTTIGYYDGAGWRQIAAPQTGAQIIAWDIRAGTSTAKTYRNGAPIGSAQNYANFALTGATAIGSNAGATATFFNGRLAELVVIDSPTDIARQRLTQYMGARYGIAVTP